MAGRPQSSGRAQPDGLAITGHHGAEHAEDLDVGVDLAHAESAALRIIGNHHLTEPAKQAGDQQHRRAHAQRQSGRVCVQVRPVSEPQFTRIPVGMNLAAESRK